ncbi:Triacylglycerol lipase [Bertholletia excelsa]
MDWAIFLGKWTRKSGHVIASIISSLVFLWLDFLETVLCVFYRNVDKLWEGSVSTAASSCYCRKSQGKGAKSSDRESLLSDTLFSTCRKNVWREMGLLNLLRKWNWEDEVVEDHDDNEKKEEENPGMGEKEIERVRWSDCSCDSCASWISASNRRLRVVVNQPSTGREGDDNDEDTIFEGKKETENVIFVHGFLSSSSIWTETVFPNLEQKNNNYRMFAVDLLGFGESPKPRECLYTLRDHLQMIEKSVIQPFQLSSFHLVAHSMGCVIALALSAHYASSVKSLTLIAPPYFRSSPSERDRESASMRALRGLADRKIWPPLLFGSAVMSWYEHLGRCVCFLICRNHRIWEWILKRLNKTSDLQLFVDLTRHTHHSAWHTMHNVICGGAELMDEYLESLKDPKVPIHVVQGNRDNVVPLECSSNIKIKVPHAQVKIIPNADHTTVILNRAKDVTRDLLYIWASAADNIREDCSL